MKTEFIAGKSKIILCFLVVLVMSGCDLSHLQRCEWYLMPNPSDEWIARVDEGYIPVCARNLEVVRENCDLQATLEFAEEHYGKKFRYSQLELDTSGKFPRKVVGLESCSGDEDVFFMRRWIWQFDDWILKNFPDSNK